MALNFTEYIQQTWKNKPDTSTPLSAERLNHMERGLKEESNAIKALVDNVNELLGKNKAFTSVSVYGAVGDGVTDDTLALQKALNATGMILFESGKTYLISSELQVKSNTYIYGSGAIIKAKTGYASETNLMMARNYGKESTVGGYEQNKNICIHGLKFDFGGIENLGGIGIGHARNVVIRDCEFYNFASWHPIELNSCNGGIVDNCYFHDGPKSGMTFGETVQIDGAYGVGVFELSPYDNTVSKNISVVNCRFDLDSSLHDTRETFPVCVGSHWTAGDFHENILIANNICNGAHTFIGAHNWKNARIENNICTDIRFAVYSWMWDQLEVCNNSFIFSSDAMKNNGTNRGIYTNSESATFSGNGCTLIHGSVTVKNNRMEDCASHAICLSGSRCVVEGNHVINCKNNGIYASWDAAETFVANNIVTGSAGTADIYINAHGGTSPVTYVLNNVCDTLKGTGVGNSTQKSVVANNLIRKTKSLVSSFTDSGNVISG